MRTSLPRIDPDTADRVLHGLPAEDLPGELAGVASLLARTRRMSECEPPSALIAAMATTARESLHPTATESTRKHPMLAKILTAKVAAAAVIALTATGAAAATGSLPDAAQDGIAAAASHVGVNLPSSANDRAREATEDRGPSEDNHGTTVSGVATDTETTGADKGAEISGSARDGHGQDPATTEDNPAAVETPNSGGTGTADGASGSANSTGTSHAADQADAGSANSDDHPTEP